MKNFLVKIYAYQYQMEFEILSEDGPIDIENAILTNWEKVI